MKRIGALCLIAVLVLGVCGCVDVTPEISGTPLPSASPTPLPSPYVTVYTAEEPETDLMGNRIDGADHYMRLYLSFGALRIYEYDTGTFLDGILVNGYPVALAGTIRISYYTEDGKLCGEGILHTADGGTVFEPGSNNIYAEILTDIDVQSMDFTLEIMDALQPIEAEPDA